MNEAARKLEMVKPGEPQYREAPNNVEAEQALLGAILMNNDAFYRVSDFLKPAHFYEGLHRKIFEVAGDIIRMGKTANPVTIKTFLAADDRVGDMTVAQLQSLYLATVGRSTGSTDRRYLEWKIREAEKGRIPVGPREARSPEMPDAETARVLPLRLETEAVEAMDATWKSHGMKSRMEFFRRALGHYLAHLGAHGAAMHFTSQTTAG